MLVDLRAPLVQPCLRPEYHRRRRVGHLEGRPQVGDEAANGEAVVAIEERIPRHLLAIDVEGDDAPTTVPEHRGAERVTVAEALDGANNLAVDVKYA